MDGWQRWWVVPHGVSLSRVVPRTIVGLSTQHVFGMTKVTQKMRWQGYIPQAKPIPAGLRGRLGRRGPFDMLSRRGDKVQGLARAGDSWTGKEVVGARTSGAEKVSFCVHETPVGSWARHAQPVVYCCTQVLLFCVWPSA